jgi:hypothetical protein
MKLRQSIFLLIALAMIAALVACGSSSSTPPPPPVVSIAATSGTPQNAVVGAAFSAPLVATVTTGGAPTSGVTVTFTAPASGPSGTFAGGVNTATTNASGVATSTTFTANSTIGAYAVTAAGGGASTPANFSLTNVVATTLTDGTYVFLLNGEDQFVATGVTCASATNTACGPYFVAGAFVVSGGTITSGEQDFIDLGIFKSDAITGGSVTTSTDGNLQIILNTADTSIGVSGVENLNGTLVTASTGVITEFDASATSSGFLAHQTPSVAAPSGGYAFVTAGIDGSSTPAPVAIGGVINVDGSGTISGAGSVFDINDNGTVAQNQPFAASTVTGPDSLGRVQFNLVPGGGVAAINLVGYIVGPQNIWLVETGDSFAGTMGGEALGQGGSTGTFNSTSFTSYEFGTTGADTNGTLQVAGVVNAASGTAVGGTINYNDLTGTGTQAPSSLTGGTYTVDSTGRVTLTGVTDGTVTFNLQLYLNGNGKATAISMDSGDVLAGLANRQTGGGSFTASSFSGLYATNASGFDFNHEREFDAVGLVSADGVSALGGTVDLNFMTPPGTQTPGVSVSGAFSANASGVFTGTITGFDIDNPTNNDAFTFYMVDATRALAIETDPNQLTIIKFAFEH